jgi:hypothetical protein
MRYLQPTSTQQVSLSGQIFGFFAFVHTGA